MHVPKFVFTGSIAIEVYKTEPIKYINQLIRRRISGIFMKLYEHGWNAYMNGVKTSHFL
jgi:hypothetical protein